MLSSAYLVYDVLRTAVDAGLGREPTDAEVEVAWRDFVAQDPEQVLRSALDALAEEQMRAGMPKDQARGVIDRSASSTHVGLVTALPLLSALVAGDERGFRRLAEEAARENDSAARCWRRS